MLSLDMSQMSSKLFVSRLYLYSILNRIATMWHWPARSRYRCTALPQYRGPTINRSLAYKSWTRDKVVTLYTVFASKTKIYAYTPSILIFVTKFEKCFLIEANSFPKFIPLFLLYLLPSSYKNFRPAQA